MEVERFARAAWLIAALVVPRTTWPQAAIPPLAHMHHTTWGARDGLPVGGVVEVLRSPDGYLWLGAADALIRFDGVRFVRFDSSTTPALRSAAPGLILPQLVDRSGALWIARPDGALVVYDGKTFREVSPPDGDRGRAPSIEEDASGRLWVGPARPYLIRDGRTEALNLPPGVPTTRITGMVRDTSGGMWIGHVSGGLWHVVGANAIGVDVPWRGTAGVRPILQSRDGTLWVLAAGVHMLRDGRWSSLRLPGESGELNATRAVELPDGSVLIGTRGAGVVRWKNGVVDQFTEADGLSDAVVRGLHGDAEGSVWIATDAGLDRLRPARFITGGKRGGLPFDSPNQLHGDEDGAIWVKPYGTTPLYRVDSGIVRGRAGLLHARAVAPPTGRYVVLGRARGGGVWVRSDSYAIHRYRDGVITPLRVTGLPRTRPHVVHEDGSGAVWIGFVGGGFGVARNGAFTAIPVERGRPTTFASVIVEDSTGSIWVTLNNPYMLVQVFRDRVVGQFEVAGRPEGEMRKPTVEGRGTIWAVADGDLARIVNGRMSVVQVPGIATALKSNSVVLLVARGYLWFGGETGIGRLPLSALHRAADGLGDAPLPEWFSDLDGLPTAKLTNVSSSPGTSAPDGRLWFSTPSGLAVVDPARLPVPPLPPATHIEEVRVSDRLIPQDSLLSIPPNPERVEIHFTATGLQIPERVRMQYRLDGADNDWVNVTGPRVTTYTQLRHGSYRFRIRAWNEGDEPGPETSVALRVRPAWNQTWWFVALLVLSAVVLVTLVVNAILRARNMMAAERMQARFDAELGERTRLARDLHDTLLQGFTGITLQLQAVHESLVKSPADAKAALGRILTLADQSLNEARTMVWDMRAPELDTQELADAIESAARSAIGGSAIALDFAIEGRRSRMSLDCETTMLRIGREAVANAVKHSGATAIGIMLRYEKRRVCLTVSDNGAGFDPDTIRTGTRGGHWGIIGMRERAARAGGTLEIGPTPEGGTTLVACLPFTTSPRTRAAATA